MGTDGEKSSNHLLAGLALRVGLCSFKKQEHVAANRQRSASHTTKRLDCARACMGLCFYFLHCTRPFRGPVAEKKSTAQHFYYGERRKPATNELERGSIDRGIIFPSFAPWYGAITTRRCMDFRIGVWENIKKSGKIKQLSFNQVFITISRTKVCSFAKKSNSFRCLQKNPFKNIFWVTDSLTDKWVGE